MFKLLFAADVLLILCAYRQYTVSRLCAATAVVLLPACIPEALIQPLYARANEDYTRNASLKDFINLIEEAKDVAPTSTRTHAV
jgi:hypothetical protein